MEEEEGTDRTQDLNHADFPPGAKSKEKRRLISGRLFAGGKLHPSVQVISNFTFSETVLKSSLKIGRTMYVFSLLEELGFMQENIPPLIVHRCTRVGVKGLCPSRRHDGSTISEQSHHKCRTLPMTRKRAPARTLQRPALCSRYPAHADSSATFCGFAHVSVTSQLHVKVKQGCDSYNPRADLENTSCYLSKMCSSKEKNSQN